MDLFLPSLQINDASTAHIPLASNFNGHRESFAIKRRSMTFAQAERERSERIVNLALLSNGDIVGLDSFVFDLSTYINSARCTAPCDLFYILKHNFVRLQKRHGTQGLTERLRDMVRLSIQTHPERILNLPIFDTLIRKYLTPVSFEDQQNGYYSKQSWLLHLSNRPYTVCIESDSMKSLLFFFSGKRSTRETI